MGGATGGDAFLFSADHIRGRFDDLPQSPHPREAVLTGVKTVIGPVPGAKPFASLNGVVQRLKEMDYIHPQLRLGLIDRRGGVGVLADEILPRAHRLPVMGKHLFEPALRNRAEDLALLWRPGTAQFAPSAGEGIESFGFGAGENAVHSGGWWAGVICFIFPNN